MKELLTESNTLFDDMVKKLDEYDTPLQEAYIYGYWEELTAFTRNLFNLTFKTNPCLERAIMTGRTGIFKGTPPTAVPRCHSFSSVLTEAA